MSISDRVVLMRDGLLMQEDKPQVLYDQPANCFVADFLGNPPINKLAGTIQSGAFVPENGQESIALPQFADVDDGRQVYLSVRAESFSMGDEDSPIKAKLLRSYVMGKEKLAVFRIGQQEVRAYIDDLGSCQPDDVVPLNVKDSGVFLFDQQSGGRLK